MVLQTILSETVRILIVLHLYHHKDQYLLLEAEGQVEVIRLPEEVLVEGAVILLLSSLKPEYQLELMWSENEKKTMHMMLLQVYFYCILSLFMLQLIRVRHIHI